MKNVAINASGGGSEEGNVANGIVEKDITLKISKEINNILEEYGINTLLLREGDTTISYDDRIKKLTNTFTDSKNTIVISNTLSSGGSSGIEIIYPLDKKDTLPELISDNLSKYNTVKYYQYRYPSNPIKDYYYITRNTPGYETIIIKYGYIDNKEDADIIKNNYKELASSVADAILKYLGIDKSNIKYDIYIVKSGDSLYSIAKKYNISVDELKSINNLNNNLIKVNQEIKIPSNTYYIVKSGDTLYSIAKKYNTSVNDIKNKNNLKSDILTIGSKLVI